jgi:hypothetical protein
MALQSPSQQSAHSLLTVCSQSVHSQLTVCSQSAHSLLTICSQSAHSLLTVCSQSAHSLLTICSQSAHSLLTVCSVLHRSVQFLILNFVHNSTICFWSCQYPMVITKEFTSYLTENTLRFYHKRQPVKVVGIKQSPSVLVIIIIRHTQTYRQTDGIGE